MTRHMKDPAAVLDFRVDWTAWLAAEGDTATSITWTVPDGLTQPKEPTRDGGKATVWLAGGELGQDYTITCRITTTAGRVDDRSIRLVIRER